MGDRVKPRTPRAHPTLTVLCRLPLQCVTLRSPHSSPVGCVFLDPFDSLGTRGREKLGSLPEMEPRVRGGVGMLNQFYLLSLLFSPLHADAKPQGQMMTGTPCPVFRVVISCRGEKNMQKVAGWDTTFPLPVMEQLAVQHR